MNLLNIIKGDQLQARKDRDKVCASTLTTLLAEATSVGMNDGKRDSTDAEVTAVVKKFIKNLQEFIDAMSEEQLASDLGQQKKDEMNLYLTYLQKQMTEAELTRFIESVVDNFDECNMGTVMTELKTHCAGEYDGRMASQIAKQVLSAS